MKLTTLIGSIVLASWFGAIAIFASQNLTSVSLKFLMFESIAIPLGQLLAFSVGLGLLLGAIAPFFLTSRRQPTRGSKLGREKPAKYRRGDTVEDWLESKSPEW